MTDELKRIWKEAFDVKPGYCFVGQGKSVKIPSQITQCPFGVKGEAIPVTGHEGP
jgi:hypothetical protein